MSRLTESVGAMALVILALLFTAVGIASNVAGFSTPDSWLLTAMGFGVLSVAVAMDEQRLSLEQVTQHPFEHWFGRALILVSIAFQLVGFGLGLAGSDTRNLWSVMGIILALIGLSGVVDSHRISVARSNRVGHELTDAIAGVVCAAVAFGFGIFGFFTGLFGEPHAEAWLFGGAVVSVVGVAFMFDEMVHVSHKARTRRHVPFKG